MNCSYCFTFGVILPQGDEMKIFGGNKPFSLNFQVKKFCNLILQKFFQYMILYISNTSFFSYFTWPKSLCPSCSSRWQIWISQVPKKCCTHYRLTFERESDWDMPHGGCNKHCPNCFEDQLSHRSLVHLLGITDDKPINTVQAEATLFSHF